MDSNKEWMYDKSFVGAIMLIITVLFLVGFWTGRAWNPDADKHQGTQYQLEMAHNELNATIGKLEAAKEELQRFSELELLLQQYGIDVLEATYPNAVTQKPRLFHCLANDYPLNRWETCYLVKKVTVELDRSDSYKVQDGTATLEQLNEGN